MTTPPLADRLKQNENRPKGEWIVWVGGPLFMLAPLLLLELMPDYMQRDLSPLWMLAAPLTVNIVVPILRYRVSKVITYDFGAVEWTFVSLAIFSTASRDIPSWSSFIQLLWPLAAIILISCSLHYYVITALKEHTADDDPTLEKR